MIKTIITSFFFLLSVTFSQEIKKETTIIADHKYLRNTHLLEYNNCYYLYGFSVSNNRDTTSIHFTKVDRDFDIVWDSKTSKADSINYLFSDFSFINKTKNINLIASYGSLLYYLYLETIDTSGNRLYQIDSLNLKRNFMGQKGKIIVNKKFDIYHIYSIGSDFAGKLMLQSYSQDGKFIRDDTIYRLNSTKYNEIKIRSAVSTKDSGFAVTGDFYNKSNYKYDVFVIKFDKNKNIIWESITKSDSARQTPARIVETNSGEIIVLGYLKPYTTTINPATNFVRKYNSDGSLIWDKSYFENVSIANTNLFEAPNGYYYIIANTYQKSISSPPDTYYNFCIIKTNKDGDLLWKKIWGKPDVQNYLNAIVFDSNNDLVVSGVQGDYTYIARIKDTTTTNVTDNYTTENSLLVSPNPALNFIELKSTIKSAENCEIIIYNSIGEKVYSKRVPFLVSQRIDVSTFSSGLYFIRYGSEHIKFIKE
jgi:hypothetical protein